MVINFIDRWSILQVLGDHERFVIIDEESGMYIVHEGTTN